MTSRLARVALFLTPTALCLVIAASMGPGCTGMPAGCQDDGDCPDGQLCVVDTGACVACISAADCEAGSACCNGECITGDQFENSCGCSPDAGGRRGNTCSPILPICVVDGARATAENLADGVCRSPCNPDLGGTISSVDNTEAGGFSCTCDGGDDEGTCNVPFLRADGWPHRGADLCDPTEKCTCFASNQRCPAASPDCVDNQGCVDLHEDINHCGITGNDCTDSARGPDDGSGVCVNGGCTCNLAADCQYPGANVDSCQLVGEGQVNQCVCDDYTENGLKAGCPMQLACVAGGCELDGVVYATLDALLTALRLSPMSMETDGGL